MPSQFSSIDAAVSAISRGECVIVVDAEDRENEGDFVCAGDAATPGIVNFMITHGRGQVFLSILPDVAKRLELPKLATSQWASPVQPAVQGIGTQMPQTSQTNRAPRPGGQGQQPGVHDTGP